jgi:hypothetical protein
MIILRYESKQHHSWKNDNSLSQNVNKELFPFAEGWSPLTILLEVCINFEKLRVRSK